MHYEDDILLMLMLLTAATYHQTHYGWPAAS
jgi:hypothetical protein